MHEHFGLPVTGDGLFEGLDDELGALRLVDAVPHHKTAVVIEKNQRERGRAADPTLHKIEVPHVIGAHGLKALLMPIPPHSRRSITGILHHFARCADRDFDPTASQLVSDL